MTLHHSGWLWGRVGVTVESIWGDCGYMRVTLQDVGVTLGHCGVTFGSVWRHSGIALGLLCGHCGVTLCNFRLLCDHFQVMWVTLESPLFVFEKQALFQHISMVLFNSGVNLRRLWGRFGLTLSISG